MRLILFANNWLGWKVAQYLGERGEDVSGLVLHPESRRKFGNEIVSALKIDEDRVFDGSRLRDESTVARLRQLKPTLGVSAMFGYILKRDVLEVFKQGCVNIHTGFPPFNRGAYPNVWSIVEGTPAGAMIHYIDEDVDTGDVVGKKQVEVEPIDTGESLYRKLEIAALELFQQTWPAIRSGSAPRTAQDASGGTHHRVSDVDTIDRIDLDSTYSARYLIDVLRARTFPPYKGAYFVEGGKRVFLRLQLEYES